MKVAEKQLGNLCGRLAEIPLRLCWEKEAVEWLAGEGFDERYGARPLRGLIRRRVEDALAEQLLEGRLLAGDEVELAVREGELVVLRREEQAAAAFAAGDVNEL